MYFNFKLLIIALVFILISCEMKSEHQGRAKHKDHPGNSLWKKEYEDELNDAMLSTKHEKNFTRVVQSSDIDNEAVLEKLMDSITASEKYLKKVESIDFRLNRLDIEVHEKTNAIIKRLTEILKTVQSQFSPENAETVLSIIKSDVAKLRSIIDKSYRTTDGTECQLDTLLDTRLSFLENNIKSIMGNVDSINGIISEVKSRPHSSKSFKADYNGGVESMSLISEFRRAIHDIKSRKCDCKFGRVDRTERYPTDCHEIQEQGFNVSGIYKIRPDDIEAFYVLCDLTSSGGGWTVIQNRFDGSQDFYKGWTEYKHGFGNLAGEFWLGLEKMFYLTNQKLYELRVEIEASNGQDASASFSVFTIGPEFEGFRISTLGTYRGNAGDSLSYHAGQKFSTYDVDNDDWKEGACSVEHGGAWWYKKCDKSNLNGRFPGNPEENNEQAIYWITFKGPHSPLYKTRMMIRPLPATRALEYSEHALRLRTNNALETSKLQEKHKARGNEKKGAYDIRGRSPYRYDDNVHSDGFFPNYA